MTRAHSLVSPAAVPRLLLVIVVAALAGCAFTLEPSPPPPSAAAIPASPAEARALIAKVLPPPVTNRAGWATDMYAAMAVMEIAPSVENICSVVAITDQESNFRVDPPVP